jgi:hypothetical protein
MIVSVMIVSVMIVIMTSENTLLLISFPHLNNEKLYQNNIKFRLEAHMLRGGHVPAFLAPFCGCDALKRNRIRENKAVMLAKAES